VIEVRPTTADEMVLAFVRAEIDSPTDHGEALHHALSQLHEDRARLIDRADLMDERQNHARRSILGAARGYGRNLYLFRNFPYDTTWRLVTVTPAQVADFKYANCEPWTRLSGSSRLVADGVNNLNRGQNKAIQDNVAGIAARLSRGDRFQALVAVECGSHTAQPVLMEGHTRATAYALTDSPGEIDVIIGSSATMNRWAFF
jgi:hypothetical protein